MLTSLPRLPHLPIGTIFCIGRNFAEHAKELNNPIPGNPIVFTKPTTALIGNEETVEIPAGTSELHHEAEMVVAIGKGGRHIARKDALTHVAGYAIGIDVTDRALQSALKEKAHPWVLAKGLDTFAPLGEFVPASLVTDPTNVDIKLTVNGEIRQLGNTKDMLFPVDDLIARLSTFFTLRPGDLIYTGTPAGVGPMRNGDIVETTLGENLSQLRVNVRQLS